jgi:hypothetical protein
LSPTAIPQPKQTSKIQAFSVYNAAYIHIVDGANFGDTLSFADDLILDDAYMLAPDAALHQLSITLTDAGLRINEHGETGDTSNQLFVDCSLTLMSHMGQTVEAIVLVEVNSKNLAVSIYLLPLASIQHKTKYSLIKIDRETAEIKLSQLAYVSFVKGTQLTLPTGEMKPIEELKTGDQLLTHDAGIQKIRWIGHSTVRATGAQAPILKNDNDLVLCPDHRLYIYQHDHLVGHERAETLVRGRHLVDGKNVVWLDIGYIDYYQLLFDEHQIIYAEGIAAESLLFDHRTQPSLGDDVAKGLSLHKTIYSADIEISKTNQNDDSILNSLQKVLRHN